MENTRKSAEDVGFRGASGLLSEFLLILAIHFHAEQRNELENVVRKELSIESITLKSLTIQRIKTLFTSKLYTHESLTKLAISVPPTEGLRNGI